MEKVGYMTLSLGSLCRVQTSGRIHTVVVFAILLLASVASAVLIGSITFVFVRTSGVAHALAISAVAAAIVLLANGAALALANARSESDVLAGELTTVEEQTAHARAS
jgi:hypothetical protein